MSGLGFIRSLAIGIGVLLLVGGFAGIAVGGPSLAIFSFWSVLIDLFLIAAVLLERTRYRSEHGDRLGEAPGRAGGEPHGTTLEPRFQPTDEHFEDPTTRQRMRVWLDPHTGERRYLPEE